MRNESPTHPATNQLKHLLIDVGPRFSLTTEVTELDVDISDNTRRSPFVYYRIYQHLVL